MSVTPDKAHQVGFFGVDIPSYDQIINCMRCGMCLAHCPTYTETGLERSSPRGRVALIRAIADGMLGITGKFIEEIYFCLDCRACETACPAGVKLSELFEAARVQIEGVRRRSLFGHLVRNVFLERIFPFPRRLRLSAWPLILYQRMGLRWVLRSSGLLNFLPWNLGGLERILPTLPVHSFLDEVTPPKGRRRCRIGFLSGCIMGLVFTDVNRATVRVLAQNGCEVVTPKGQVCCGALHAHIGQVEAARDMARRNIDAFERAEVDVIVTNAAGCGAMMKEYGYLLRNDPQYAGRAEGFSRKVKDVSEFLVDLPLNSRLGEVRARVTYDDPCHLIHGQGISQEPRVLLRAIPELELVELKESDWCCGSAGIYNITHYDFSMELLDRKVRNIAATGASVVVSGNPGCLLQLGLGVRQMGMRIRVAHPIELLDEAYQAALSKTE